MAVQVSMFMDAKGITVVSIAVVIAPALLAQRQIEPRIVRPSNALSVEAESLVGSAQTILGQVAVQNMQGFGSGWSGGAQLFWGGAKSGGKLMLSFSTPVAGRYAIVLHFTRAPDFGIVSAQVDDVGPVTFNGYAPTVSRDRVLIGVGDLRAGTHQLRLEVTSKDGKSTGFNVGLDRIELQPVVEQPASRNPAGRGETAGAAGTTIPVLHVSGGSSRDDSRVQPNISPLPMSARTEVVQKALSSTSTPSGQPGTPIRLSAAVPRLNLSGLFVMNGLVNAGWDSISLQTPKATLGLYFDPVEPHRPHLLECDCFGGWDGKPIPVRVSTPIPGQKGTDISDLKYVELTVVTFLGKDWQRLLAVVMPSEARMVLQLAPKTEYGFTVHYCELTPFK